MKNFDYIFEEYEKRDSSDIELDDVVYAAKKKPDILKKMVKFIEDSDKYSDSEKKDIIKQIRDAAKESKEESSDNTNESVINEDEEIVKGGWITDFCNSPANAGLIDVIHMYKNQHTMERYDEMIEKEKDPEKKKELQQRYDNFKKAVRVVDRRGERSLGNTDRAIKRNIKLLKEKGELPEDYSYHDVKAERKKVKEQYKEMKKHEKKENETSKEEPEEETVKDKDGVEWIKRKKERGDGFTYCRKDDRSVTMSQEEYNKKNAQKNESLGMSLKDFIIESLN